MAEDYNKRVYKGKIVDSDIAKGPGDEYLGSDVKSRLAAVKSKLSGLIFMCNSVTIDDCFQHKVFGMPSSRRDLVQKVYPGMKLFLFDIDTRLMHGIYEASSLGGNELVPNAFRRSKKPFPAQVRFRYHSNREPLPEDIFMIAIKDNYVERNRFKLELNAEQVNHLSRLFLSADGSKPLRDEIYPKQRYINEYGSELDEYNLAPRDPVIARDDFMADSHYRCNGRQFDAYQPRMDMNMMQHNMDGILVMKPRIDYGEDYMHRAPLRRDELPTGGGHFVGTSTHLSNGEPALQYE